jgi:hypothetical protein
MGIFGKLFKSDESDEVSTKNSEIINALKILQNGSLSHNERAGALTRLKSIFLASHGKDDLKAISQSILKIVTNDESLKIRESALTTYDTIIEAAPPPKVSIISGHAMPILIEVAKYKKEDAQELRRMAFWTLLKIAPFAITDEHLGFLAHSLDDKTENIRMAVICTFENLVKGGDDALKSRIARFSMSALCRALDDSAIWVRAARTLDGLGKYALGAAPFLFKRLDDKEGEWAAGALRTITGQQYGNQEKQKWEQWLQKNVVK